MKRLVVGTAGHIDHGKTRLIEALTGIDCDRWQEEKARGITIDLGFAHLEDDDPVDGALQLGLVDVPGHERFLHNALAGLGGIRLMLLVVAADEGVKPQTLEHLAICRLLGIDDGIVALTKSDLVDDDLLELAELEVAEALAADGGAFADAPIVPVSSVRGDGIDTLRGLLVDRGRALAEEPDAELPCRLPIDRAFQLRGLGAVVTGTLAAGRIGPGDQVSLLPSERTARVRGVQVHGGDRDATVAGERAALQLTGVELGELERGQQLTAPGAFAASRSVVARCTLLADAAPLTSFVPVRFHLFSSEVVGKMRPIGGALGPGEEGPVEIRLARPIVAIRGDRFIVRRPSPAATLGGGVILDPRWRRRRGASLAAAARDLGDDDRTLVLWVGERRERGASADELAPRLGLPTERVAVALDRLAEEGRLLRADAHGGRRWLAPRASARVLDRARKVLGAYFKDNRLARGMAKAELLGRVLPKSAHPLAAVYLEWMKAAKILEQDGDLVNLPGRNASLDGEESQLSRRLLAELEAGGLTPPSPGEVAIRLGAKPQIAAGVQRFLLDGGELVRLPQGLIVARRRIDELCDELARDSRRELTVPEFKERYGLSRKWAIPLLEHLDSLGVTRRVGDRRQVVADKRSPKTPAAS